MAPNQRVAFIVIGKGKLERHSGIPGVFRHATKMYFNAVSKNKTLMVKIISLAMVSVLCRAPTSLLNDCSGLEVESL
ncbi:hypothetical protein ACT691_17955 [Vibrio metschnikovii]